MPGKGGILQQFVADFLAAWLKAVAIFTSVASFCPLLSAPPLPLPPSPSLVSPKPVKSAIVLVHETPPLETKNDDYDDDNDGIDVRTTPTPTTTSTTPTTTPPPTKTTPTKTTWTQRFLGAIQRNWGISRDAIAEHGVYFSHETCTHATPTASCSFNEVSALRQCFGEELLSRLVIINTKVRWVCVVGCSSWCRCCVAEVLML